MQKRKDTPETNVDDNKKKLLIILVLLVFLFAILGVMSIVEKRQEAQTEATSTTSKTVSTTSTSTLPPTETTTIVISVVPEGAVVENRNGSWGLYKDGLLISNFTGIATNEYGKWYLENGLVNFKYSGSFSSNGNSYTIINGQVEVPTTTTTVKKTTTTTVKYNNLPEGVRDLVLRSERYATNHIDKGFTNKYKFEYTSGSILDSDKEYVNELPPQSNNAVVNVYFNAEDGTSATFTFSSEYGGVLKLKYVYINSSLPSASPLGNES